MLAQPLRPSLELLLLIDVSVSVDIKEFELQKAGIIQTFSDPKFQHAVVSMPGGIAVSVMMWSGVEAPRPILPWAVISDYATIEAFTAEVAAMPRAIGGFEVTAIGTALIEGIAALGTNGIEADRMVIDIAGDGYNNDGIAPAEARDMAEAAGITVNALAVVEEPRLPEYFRQNVITQDGFVHPIPNYDAFIDGMNRKLWLEISGISPDWFRETDRG